MLQSVPDSKPLLDNANGDQEGDEEDLEEPEAVLPPKSIVENKTSQTSFQHGNTLQRN